MTVENVIIIGDYLFKNYAVLDEFEQKVALEFRNKNKEWMVNQNIINIVDHTLWIKNLSNNKEVIYYLVFKNNIPFMSIDYHDISYNKKEAYWGYFLGNQDYKSEVLKVEKIIIDIAFNKLNFEKLICINDINNHVINIHKFFGFKEDGIVNINGRDFLKMYLLRSK